MELSHEEKILNANVIVGIFNITLAALNIINAFFWLI